MRPKRPEKANRRGDSETRSPAPGDWMESKKTSAPAAGLFRFPVIDYEKDAYSDIEGGTSALAEVYKKIESGQAQVVDAVLFCARFNQDGVMLREVGRGVNKKPYRMFRTRSHEAYARAMRIAEGRFESLEKKLAKAMESRPRRRTREFFTSSSDSGSTYQPDPNQYTEYTPYFNGPHSKQQYFDYFVGHSRAFEAYNHNPVAKRIIDILVQYAFGRGFQVRCKNDDYADQWMDFNRANRITHKLRKYWMREYLIYGENFIDNQRWVSVDPSTIYDIICEGYDEHIDKVLYYQQMFQTATQMYAGIAVPGVPKSRDSKVGQYIIRQIPYDQIIHIKSNVTSIEKRGRSVLYSVLGWLKRLTDTLNAQVLGEQLRASFVWDDTVQGDQADVDAHGAKYNYIPVAPSIFVHNEAVTRKPLTPMQGVTAGATNVVQEILAIIATAAGLPKEHLNVMMAGGSNRATAVVGSEPFTKVIEDLQEDGSDLIHQILHCFCAENGIDYDESDWQVIFPSVQKDALNDRLKAIATCQELGWFSHERAATMAAAEMEADSYEYTDEMAKAASDNATRQVMGLPGDPKPDPKSGNGDDQKQPDNPIHGKGKKDIIKQHKKL